MGWMLGYEVIKRWERDRHENFGIRHLCLDSMTATCTSQWFQKVDEYLRKGNSLFGKDIFVE